MDRQLESPPVERRQYFRICYPAAERPIFVTDLGRLEVTEAAEKGFRVAAIGLGQPGDWLFGRFLFKDGHETEVEASIMRIQKGETVLKDASGISLTDMVREQRRLLETYPVSEFLMGLPQE